MYVYCVQKRNFGDDHVFDNMTVLKATNHQQRYHISPYITEYLVRSTKSAHEVKNDGS